MTRIVYSILGLALLQALPAAAAPKAEIPERRFEFGILGQGEELRHSFTVHNKGDAPLTLAGEGVQPHVRLASDPPPIAAGATGTVELIFDASVPEGPTEVSLALTSNDPAQPKLFFALAGQVKELLRAKPGYARWNTVQGEKEATIGQTLATSDGATFRVTSVDAPPYVKTAVREARPEERVADAPGPQWRVDLTLDSWAPVGAISGSAVVHTDNPKQHQALIPLSGFVRPIVFVDPPTGELGTVNVGATAKIDFKVRFFGTTPIRLTAAEITVPGARTTVAPVQDGRLYQVTLQLTPEVAAGPLSGKLILRTDSVKLPVYELPLTGKVEGSAPASAPAPAG
jgi:hypothetical protein